jgi:hypothetical protein
VAQGGFDSRPAFNQCLQECAEPGEFRVDDRSDPERALGAGAEAPRRLVESGKRRQNLLRLGGKKRSLLGQAQAGRYAAKQGDARLPGQPFQLQGHGRLRDAQLFCGAGDVALPRHRDECP